MKVPMHHVNVEIARTDQATAKIDQRRCPAPGQLSTLLSWFKLYLQRRFAVLGVRPGRRRFCPFRCPCPSAVITAWPAAIDHGSCPYTPCFCGRPGECPCFGLQAQNAPLCFSTGTHSPVSAASSTFRLALSRMRASAGTASPASSTTTSPGTSSSLFGASRCFPSRSTLLVAAVNFLQGLNGLFRLAFLITRPARR